MNLQELRITRPNGTLMYQAVLDLNSTFAIGKLIVSDGRLMLISTQLDDKGSIVRPDDPWVGNLNFAITTVEES